MTEPSTSIDDALRQLVGESACPVIVEDEHRIVTYANDAFGSLFLGGAPGSAAVGIDCATSARQAAEGFTEVSAWLEATERIVAERVPVGAEIWQLATGRWVERDYLPRFHGQTFVGHAWIYRDVTDRERLRQQAQDLTLMLATTAPAPSTFDAGRRTIGLAMAQHGGHATMALVKVQNVERINLETGRETGDAVLAAVPLRLSAALPGASIGRISGATFAIVCDADIDPAALARTIREATGTITTVGTHPVLLRVCVGVAAGEPGDGETLQARARIALGEAQRSGRDVVYSQAMSERERRLDQLGLALPTAIRSGELSLVYQPFVRLADRTVCGHEALVRWERPGFGTVTAASFVPVAEDLGIAGELDAWVLAHAAASASPVLAALGGQHLGVNVSADTVNRSTGFAGWVAAAIEESGIQPASLIIELTETAAAAYSDAGIEALREIRALGVGVAIDDFGVGLSSLGLLREVPFDHLKLDKSFARGIADPRVRSLISRTVAIAEDFGAEVIAEGIEREIQVDALLGCGVRAGQGWLLGMPQPLPGS